MQPLLTSANKAVHKLQIQRYINSAESCYSYASLVVLCILLWPINTSCLLPQCTTTRASQRCGTRYLWLVTEKPKYIIIARLLEEVGQPPKGLRNSRINLAAYLCKQNFTKHFNTGCIISPMELQTNPRRTRIGKTRGWNTFFVDPQRYVKLTGLGTCTKLLLLQHCSGNGQQCPNSAKRYL